jgi:tetratricopeptide (TPR) repeat protein
MKVTAILLLVFFVVLSCNAGYDTAARKKAEELCQKGLGIKLRMSSESDHSYWIDEIKLYEQAMAADSTYAPPYVYASLVYGSLARIDEMTEEEANDKRRWALKRALELDPNFARAHVAMGQFQNSVDKDIKGAEKSFQRALELGPQDSEVQRYYAWHLNSNGKYDEALSYAQKACELDPKSLQAKWALGHMERMVGNFDKSIAAYQDMIDMNPNIIGDNGPTPYRALGYTHMLQGNYTEASQIAQQGLKIKPNQAGLKTITAWGYGEQGMLDEALALFEENNDRLGVGWIYAKMNRRDEALKIIEEFKTGENKDKWWTPWNVANIYLAMGEQGQALDGLEKTLALADQQQAKEGRRWFELSVAFNKEYDSLRSNPRFQILIEKTGLKDTRMTTK